MKPNFLLSAEMLVFAALVYLTSDAVEVPAGVVLVSMASDCWEE